MRKQAIAAKICRDKFRRLVFALLILAIMFVWAPPIFGGQGSASPPNPQEVQNVAKRVNDYWSANRPGPEDNDWSRSVYFIGNMAYYQMTGDLGSLDKSWQWAETDSRWQLIGGCQTVFAAYQTAGQTYLALYQIDPQRAKLACLLTS